MEPIHQTFEREIDSRWKRHVVGSGSLELTGSTLQLMLSDASARGSGVRATDYSNAQIDDYQGLPRRRFLWYPPLKMTVQARFSAPAQQLQGTAGFGFWNDPFLMTGKRAPTFPRAVWFFYASAASNMKLDLDVPGHGWKGATIDSLHPAALAWTPIAPLAIPLMNLRPLYHALWPAIQRSLKVREVAIKVDMTHWHTYVIEWDVARARFSIAGRDSLSPPSILLDAPSPKGPLGFVMWMDNQYLVATPWGRLRWGILDAPGRQWMEVAQIAIEPLQTPRIGQR